MYDNKEVKLLKRDKDSITVNESGIVDYKWKEIGIYSVDIQPITKEKAKRIYGEFNNSKYQVFVNGLINNLNTTDFIITYKDIKYEILSFIEWDDEDFEFTEILIGRLE